MENQFPLNPEKLRLLQPFLNAFAIKANVVATSILAGEVSTPLLEDPLIVEMMQKFEEYGVVATPVVTVAYELSQIPPATTEEGFFAEGELVLSEKDEQFLSSLKISLD